MNIFPKEILEHTTQYFVPKNTVKGKLLYALILICLGAAFFSMPFISVPIYTTAPGIIKSDVERVSLTSINSGKIIYLNLNNNQLVSVGDTLAILETTVLDRQIQLNQSKIERLGHESEDLGRLLSHKRLRLDQIITAKYQKELIQYQSKLNEHYTKINKVKEDFKRNEKLFKKGVIAKVEYENTKLEHDLAKNALYQFQRQKFNEWQVNLTEANNFLEELNAEIEQALGNRQNYIIKAPIRGSLMIKEGLQKGSFVNAGSILGTISPDTDLIAECYVSPKDIALINRDKGVKLQIDAFNYNQWGLAVAKIKNISDDIEFIENQPLYRIQSEIETKHLKLKNGYQGKLNKGMTLNARFELTERTLYQLLYDKMDDWLNPGNQQSKISRTP